jgi:hypothetical protein
MKTDAWAIIILSLVAVSCFAIGYTYKSIRILRQPAIIQYVAAPETDERFRQLQKKHGQDGTIILKQEWVYYLKGKRCVLK